MKTVIESALELFGSNKAETALRVLNQIYKDATDDRLCKLAASVFRSCEAFTKQNPDWVAQDARLTQLVVHAF